MNSFINNAKNNKEIYSKLKEKYKELIDSLNTRKQPFDEVFDDLDDNYCEADKLLLKNIYLGCIYIFEYDYKYPSIYNNIVKISDPTPLLLVTAENNELVRGINLNLCTIELKTLILNIICNLDEKFFNGGYVELCAQKKQPVSTKILQFMQKNGEQQIINALNTHFKGVDYGSIFRTYKKSKIKKLKFIEYYLWPYLPAIEYKGLSGQVMNQYWKLSKIDTIKM